MWKLHPHAGIFGNRRSAQARPAPDVEDLSLPSGHGVGDFFAAAGRNEPAPDQDHIQHARPNDRKTNGSKHENIGRRSDEGAEPAHQRAVRQWDEQLGGADRALMSERHHHRQEDRDSPNVVDERRQSRNRQYNHESERPLAMSGKRRRGC